MKLNGLTDPMIIDALYRASGAGVDVQLCVRSLCCIRPQVPGLSERISVRSIVGEFLEHSRIYSFGGGDGGVEETFIGSADLMERNLDRRIEVLTPVLDPRLAAQIHGLLDLVFADTASSWFLSPEGAWSRSAADRSISLQETLKSDALTKSRRWLDLATTSLVERRRV